MIKLEEFEYVNFLNFVDEKDVRKFVFGEAETPAEPIYKYTLWKNAKASLKDRYFWMSNPSVWEDPFEKYFLNAQYEDSAGNLMGFPFKNKVFCNCLTPDHNSEAHWITYAKKRLGVSLRIDVKELVDKLNLFGKANHNNYKVYLGKVSYLKQSQIQANSILDIPLYEDSKGRLVTRDIGNPDFCANLMLLKRNSFKHDNEVRLIIIQKNENDNINEEVKGKRFQYNYDSASMLGVYDNDKLISRVYTSPFFGLDKRDSVRKELEKKKYGFNLYPSYYKNTGKTVYKSRVLRSQLYSSIGSKKILLYKLGTKI